MYGWGLSEDEGTLILIAAESNPWRSPKYPSKETARFQIHAGA